MVDALKRAEDSQFFVLRIHEDRGEQVTAKITFAKELGITSVKQINSLEQDDEKSVQGMVTKYSFDQDSGILTVLLKAFKIATFALNKGD